MDNLLGGELVLQSRVIFLIFLSEVGCIPHFIKLIKANHWTTNEADQRDSLHFHMN